MTRAAATASLPGSRAHPRLTIVGAALPSPLPTVRALARLWEDVTARPLWLPPNLGRYLRLRWRMRLERIDPRKVRLAVQPGKLNDCQSCTDICCVGPRATVLLRLRDIATLLDIGRPELISAQKPVFAAADLANRPALRRHVGSTAWQRFPVLARDAMGACAALRTDGTCGLYPHWPLSCARFPYSLHADDLEIFYSTRCDAYWLRDDAGERINGMALAAVAAYNERIKDAILLAYVPERLAALGLMTFLDQSSECASTV